MSIYDLHDKVDVEYNRICLSICSALSLPKELIEARPYRIQLNPHEYAKFVASQ